MPLLENVTQIVHASYYWTYQEIKAYLTSKGFTYALMHLKKRFLIGSKRIIGLDGRFLKGVFRGKMLSAMGRNGNDNIYPIAWAMVELKNKDNWNWFINLLVNDLGESGNTKWTFISDK